LHSVECNRKSDLDLVIAKLRLFEKEHFEIITRHRAA